ISEKGTTFADLWFWQQTLKSIPKFIKHSIYWGITMLLSYFKTAVRSIVKQKEYSIINVAGLAVGLASAIIILFWVQNELSYDDFHKDKDDIYRVLVQRTVDGDTFAEWDTPYLISNELKDKIPGIEYSTTYLQLPRFVVKSGDNKFYEEGIRAVGADFFSLFTFNFIEGNAGTALSNPGSMAISKSMALKYFGNTNAMGKIMQVDGVSFTVTGIFNDVPESSHIKFDFMIDTYFIENTFKEMLSWNNFSSQNYVKLHKGANPEFTVDEINSVVLKNYDPEDIGKYDVKFILQPLQEIYLTSAIKKYIYIFSLLAVLILFIASMNYVNLSTAISLRRLKEVGIRKVVGSNSWQLINQFLVETIIITIIASCLAIIIDVLFLPVFNELVGKTISIDFMSYQFLATLAAVIIITSLLAGSYPAFYISSFKPVTILKGNSFTGTKSNRFRRLLVISQYTISIGLIICTIVVSDQVYYMKNKDVGFDKDHILYIPLTGGVKEKFDLVKHSLSSNPNIEGTTASLYLPTARGRSRSTIEWAGKDPDQRVSAEMPEIDYNYFGLLELEIVKGRDFSKEFSSDPDEAFIINEKMAKQMNTTSPIGEEISVSDRKGKVIGVVKDANFLSLRSNIEPQVFSLLTEITATVRGVILIKLRETSGKELSQTVSFIEDIWNEFNPDEPFEFHFWSESMEEIYNSEQTISKLFSYFSILAIFISCLSLFGLVSLIVEQRRKEIGIRKSIGASVSSIVLLLTKEFLAWVLIANIIAWPIAYWIMNGWLEDFAYKNDLTIWSFVVSGGIALLVALFTISYQSVKASLTNPVDTLKCE
ncbi:MAG: ABC transporter permease, partial [bacterium]